MMISQFSFCRQAGTKLICVIHLCLETKPFQEADTTSSALERYTCIYEFLCLLQTLPEYIVVTVNFIIIIIILSRNNPHIR